MNASRDLDAFVEFVIGAVSDVAGSESSPLHEPLFFGNEWEYLKECLDSSYVSSVGLFVDEFEKALASYTGSRFAISVVNGTAALQIALQLSGVRAGDEVLVPTLTFVATANAVSYCGATPHFVDCEEQTLGISAEKLKNYLKSSTKFESGNFVNKNTNRVIRAIVIMHTFGHPSCIDDIMTVAKEFNLVVIEDAAEAIGSFYNGRHAGTFGLLGTLSFNGNKTITTGGGGAILTDDENLARRAKHLTTTAKRPHDWDFIHDEVGYNYRMPNLNAALGCAQLEQLPRIIEMKRNLFLRYEKSFQNLSGVELLREPAGCRSNYWLQAILLDLSHAEARNEILRVGNRMALAMRPTWMPLHELIPYKSCPRMDLSTATSMHSRIINLPSSPKLGRVSVE